MSHNCAGTAFVQGDSSGGSKLIEQTLQVGHLDDQKTRLWFDTFELCESDTFEFLFNIISILSLNRRIWLLLDPTNFRWGRNNRNIVVSCTQEFLVLCLIFDTIIVK